MLCFELLGLTRLGRTAFSLICMGDKHQLRSLARWTVWAACQSPHAAENCSAAFKPNRLLSILYVRRLSHANGAVIKLTTQYRVPCDIASMLNARVYVGDYQTTPGCGAPPRGLRLNHASQRIVATKYMNDGEIYKCLELYQVVIGRGVLQCNDAHSGT